MFLEKQRKLLLFHDTVLISEKQSLLLKQKMIQKLLLYLLHVPQNHALLRKRPLVQINKNEVLESLRFLLGNDMVDEKHSKLVDMPRMMEDFVVLERL